MDASGRGTRIVNIAGFNPEDTEDMQSELLDTGLRGIADTVIRQFGDSISIATPQWPG